jgi:hypothetical protein
MKGVDGAEPTPGRPLRWRHVRTGTELIWRIPFTVASKLHAAGDRGAADAASRHTPAGVLREEDP